ncbi:unnamed protein product [Arabidopsis arenosa]|uniref:RanBD1 domain-containing protein n=1 Tax=Arabidopsis arenosa TaxID=38785 RepID=A0A8S2AVB6_ARAAE|nr:unnamed protein product [Arabidopsis arenosa]
MRGVKRAAVSESNESPFKNAKPVEGILFGNQKNLALIQQSLLTPASLDKQRAELARKHVRALNNQFVSWVQLQLKNHPDELWEDGMNDYIAHASNILEKFKDVVNWLKENKGKGENVSPESRGAEKKLVAEVKNSDVNQAGTISTSQPSYQFSNNQPPFTSGVTPVSIQAKRDSTDDADEDEQPQPSSPSVKKAEEKGVTVVHEVKCKLYVKSNDPTDKGWKDKGTGNLYIKCKEGVDKGTKESKPTILVRNDVGKLLLNALLYTGIKTSTQKNALVAIFHSSEDSNENVTPRTFLIRTKTAEARDKLATAIQEYAPSS